jgi:hypothetical protein
MAAYDDIETIGNSAKNDIIQAWDQFIDGTISAKSLEQHFHMMTGHNESLDGIEWYVTEWRGW